MWMAPELKHRIQIQTPVQTPNDTDGSLDLSFLTVRTVWAQIKVLSEYLQIMGGSQTSDIQGYTHTFTVRRIAVDDLGAEFDPGFDPGFKVDNDLHTLKTNYFIFLESKSSVKGRRFIINGIQEDEDYHEYLKIQAHEMREEGTGYV